MICVVEPSGKALLQLFHRRRARRWRAGARSSRAPGRSGSRPRSCCSSRRAQRVVAARRARRARRRRRRTISPFGAGLDDDVAELAPRSSSRPCALTASWNSAPVGRRRADLAGGHLHVLLADRRRRRRRRSGCARPASADRARRASSSRRRRTRCTSPTPGRRASTSLHVQHGVVAQIQRVVAAVGRDQVHDHRQVRRALRSWSRRDARTSSGRRGSACCHAVLHLHLRAVEVRADLEGDGQRQRAVHRGLRGHVQHVLDADDLPARAARRRSRR